MPVGEPGGPFRDRRDAGRRLAELVAATHLDRPVVLGLPRGGVPVAFEVAEALAAPLDVVLVRKLGVPHQPELAMGALGEGGVRVLNEEVLRRAGVDPGELAAAERHERGELDRRAARIRSRIARVPLRGRVAIVVDDGIATGSTARAACEVVTAHGAGRVVLAVPVASRESVDELAGVADELVCDRVPVPLLAVGQAYLDFSQVTDDEVLALLEESRSRRRIVPIRPPGWKG